MTLDTKIIEVIRSAVDRMDYDRINELFPHYSTNMSAEEYFSTNSKNPNDYTLLEVKSFQYMSSTKEEARRDAQRYLIANLVNKEAEMLVDLKLEKISENNPRSQVMAFFPNSSSTNNSYIMSGTLVIPR